MPKRKKCSSKGYCDFMSDRLAPEVNARQKGLVEMEVLNMITGKTRNIGVAYKISAKDKGLMLNHCPWCGADIRFFLPAEKR